MNNGKNKNEKIPSNEYFSNFFKQKDIGKTDKVIIYCDSILWSTRLHWLMDTFGH
jgi:3-mercaptopyruvate sulfurtransferase SseA